MRASDEPSGPSVEVPSWAAGYDLQSSGTHEPVHLDAQGRVVPRAAPSAPELADDPDEALNSASDPLADLLAGYLAEEDEPLGSAEPSAFGDESEGFDLPMLDAVEAPRPAETQAAPPPRPEPSIEEPVMDRAPHTFDESEDPTVALDYRDILPDLGVFQVERPKAPRPRDPKPAADLAADLSLPESPKGDS